MCDVNRSDTQVLLDTAQFCPQIELTSPMQTLSSLSAQGRTLPIPTASRVLRGMGVAPSFRSISRKSGPVARPGVLIGMPLVSALLYALKGVGRIPAQSPIVLTLLVGACVMVLIGTLACSAPTLRALRIMPTEALREGG